MEHHLDIDDTASPQLSQDSPSVGSNLSQEGELNPASVKDKKKKKKKSRRHKKKEEGEGGGDINGNVQDSPKHHKKEKGERKHRKHGSKRPDPEGGNPPSMVNSTSSLEFDKIINNTDPLFSDIELDISLDDEVEKKPEILPYRPPRSRGGRGGGGGLFIPCSQLGHNNTMIKFAIIGTELKNVFQISHRMENEAARLHERISSIEQNLAQSGDGIKSATQSLKDVTSKTGDSKGDNTWSVGDKRLEELHNFVIHAAQVANVTEEKHKEALRKLNVIETELSKAEEKSRKAESKVKQLEDQFSKLTKGLVIIHDSSYREEMDVLDDDRVDDIIQKLEEAEKEADAANKELVTLQKTCDRVDFFLKHACDQYTKS